jgi:predicted  nucleic acid-binding Zn-ribbon protein
MANDLAEDLQTAIAKARALAERCDRLRSRIENQQAAPQGPDLTGDTSVVRETLSRFREALAHLDGDQLGLGQTLGDVSNKIESVRSQVNQLPEQLEVNIISKLMQKQDEFSEASAEAIEALEATYAATRELIISALDEAFDKLKQNLGEANDELENALNRIREAISDADHEVRRIIETLSKVRDTVLSACRAAGIGAEAAAPALEAATAAFGAVG